MEFEYITENELPIMLSPQDVADLLEITLGYARMLFKMDDFPSAVIGKRRFISSSDFIRWLNTKECCGGDLL